MTCLENGVSSHQWHAVPVTGLLEQPEILACVKQSLPGGAATAKSADYWRWKHVDNVFGRSSGTCARDDSTDEIIGVRCFMRWRFQNTDGAEVAAVRAVDTATSPGWRGQGVFTGMTKAAIDALHAEKTSLIFNTPNAASGPGYVKMGWQQVGRMPLYLRPLRPLRLVRGLLMRSSAGDRRPDPEEFGLSGLPDWPAIAADEDVEALIDSHERARPTTGLRTPRDPAYLDWRYGRHPQVPYRVQALRVNGQLSALAIVRPNWRFGLKELVVVELWAGDARRDLLSKCLRMLARTCDADYMIAHAGAGTVERAVLWNCGFLPAPRQGIGLYARRIGKPLSAALLAPSGWDLSLGDLELF